MPLLYPNVIEDRSGVEECSLVGFIHLLLASSSGRLFSHETPGMRRRFLARIAALATAATALGMFLVPASAEAADHQPDGFGDRDSDICSDAVASATDPHVGSILDGWGNRDMDIGAFSLGSAMAEARGGTLLEGWANRDEDIGAFASAMTQGSGNILDGWANRDIDIGTFGSAMTQGSGNILDGWANRDIDTGAPCS